ncbi:MAG: hypothetical protein FWG82_04555 [Oscillospiraceae bacterium]|nr:hypothetical protein [Oscillospiraceae bacterium]
MGLMSASQKANDRSWTLIQNAFAKAVSNVSEYTLCYGYWMKSGLFSKKMYNFAVGFRADDNEFILVQIDSDGNTDGESMTFSKNNVTEIKKTLQGGFKITSSLTDKPLILIVPGFVPDSMEDAYQLPINQQEQAAQFTAMMKNY